MWKPYKSVFTWHLWWLFDISMELDGSLNRLNTETIDLEYRNQKINVERGLR